MGMYKSEYMSIGGYDEDFTGYGADDNDLIFRLMYSGLKYYFTNSKIIHLYHGERCDSKMHPENSSWAYNYNLFTTRKKEKRIIRNQNKEWGIIC
jgi:predicted glycosyltransferase involved in capsule biosynthesis